ncbi:MAG: hypothetical protein RL693_2065 [Verrucomicrobiota bacterium]|jgi:hypothetical protein
MKILLLTFGAIALLSVVSGAEEDSPALYMHIARFSRGPIVTSEDWPVRLFNGERKLIPNKVSDKESHIASLKLIPPTLLKDYKLGTTVERDGWYFTDVAPNNSSSEKPLWILVIASKKGESYLYFNSVW